MADSDVKEIRESFETDEAGWREIRDARQKDIKALGPDSTWRDEDRRAREKAGRPCLNFDELNQYVNQLSNDVRETKRAIEVNPGPDAGGSQNDAREAEARLIGAWIRQTEYRSNAQMAYSRMFEDAASGSYGFCRIVSRYVQQKVTTPSEKSFDQELYIKPVHNPDLVTPGYFTQPDFSDCRRFWVHESYSHAEFEREFPDAEITDFSESIRLHSTWFDAKRVWVREQWELQTRPKKLVLLPNLLDPNGPPEPIWLDTIPKDERKRVIAEAKLTLAENFRERTVDDPYVCHIITNGVEILEKREDWPGRHIPIVGCVGKILWNKDERHILSLVRLALDPQQLFNYYKTCEAEEVGMTPKVPFFSYRGALDATNKTALALANQVPAGVIEIDPQPQGWNPALGPIPLPERPAYAPNIQAFEVGAESTRRSIQAATGTGFLPTEAQRQNQKSGVALREISTSAQKGAYHLIDNFEHSLRRVGDILVDLFPHYNNTPRDIYVRGKDDKPINVRINDREAPGHKEFGEQPLMVTGSEFDVTISTGPSYDTEREKASEFADQLVGVRPEVFQIIGPDVIRLKNLGPIGDKMAELLEVMQPPAIQQFRQGNKPLPPQAQQAMAQLQQAQQVIQQLQDIIKTEQTKAERDIALKQLDGDIRLALERLKGQQKIQLLGAEASVDIATREDEQAHEMAMKGADTASAAQAAEEAATRAQTQQYLSGGSTDTV